MTATPTGLPTKLTMTKSTVSSLASAVTKRKKDDHQSYERRSVFYFAQAKCALNMGLSLGGYTEPSRMSLKINGLGRDFIRLELKNYKDVTVGLLQVKLMFDCEGLQEKL